MNRKRFSLVTWREPSPSVIVETQNPTYRNLGSVLDQLSRHGFAKQNIVHREGQAQVLEVAVKCLEKQQALVHIRVQRLQVVQMIVPSCQHKHTGAAMMRTCIEES